MSAEFSSEAELIIFKNLEGHAKCLQLLCKCVNIDAKIFTSIAVDLTMILQVFMLVFAVSLQKNCTSYRM